MFQVFSQQRQISLFILQFEEKLCSTLSTWYCQRCWLGRGQYFARKKMKNMFQMLVFLLSSLLTQFSILISPNLSCYKASLEPWICTLKWLPYDFNLVQSFQAPSMKKLLVLRCPRLTEWTKLSVHSSIFWQNFSFHRFL